MPPDRKILIGSFFVTIFLFAGAVEASVVHRVEVNNDDAKVTSVLKLDSSERVNKWELTLELPENVEIHSIRDSGGNISYNWMDGKIKFETNPGPPRRHEKVRLDLTFRDVKEEKFKPLETIEFSLFGFKGETIKAEVLADHPISWYTPFGFESRRTNSSLRFQGEGSLPLRIYTSAEGSQSENYHYFSEAEISEAEEFFPLLSYLAGIQSPHYQFPVVFLEDSRYNPLINEWSIGRYKKGGLLVLRRNLSKGKMVSTILHESMHGFDARFLKWDQTKTAYFDEGMAKFVEFLVKQQIKAPQAELFGERVYFERKGKRYYLEPRSSSQELWDYYRNEEDWMKRWSPWQEESQRVREFGYAYGELLIRDYVQENGIQSLRNISAELLTIDEEVEGWKEKAGILSGILGDLRPCYTQSKKEFEQCLEKVNAQKFNLTNLNLTITYKEERGKEIRITQQEFEIQEREVSLQEKLLARLKALLKSLLERIGWILEKL